MLKNDMTNVENLINKKCLVHYGSLPSKPVYNYYGITEI